eukprot:795180-Pelagomonas_calceolata.AAC.5
MQFPWQMGHEQLPHVKLAKCSTFKPYEADLVSCHLLHWAFVNLRGMRPALKETQEAFDCAWDFYAGHLINRPTAPHFFAATGGGGEHRCEWHLDLAVRQRLSFKRKYAIL